MRWKDRSDEKREAKRVKEREYREWICTPRLWFAWRPVCTDQGWVWLEQVYRHKRWVDSTLEWKDGAGMFGGSALIGQGSHFTAWRYGVKHS